MKFQSFTTTLRGFMRGEISSDSLLSAESVEFYCARVHLFPTETMQDSIGETYPFEVLSHVREEFPAYLSEEFKRMPLEDRFEYRLITRNQYECSQTPVEVVSETVSKKYELFIAIIEQLDYEGIVSFRKNLACPVQMVRAEKKLIKTFQDTYGPDGKVDQAKKRFAEKNS